jgi:hypothetical protein
MAVKRIGQVLEAKDNEWWHEINENFPVD